MSVYTLSQCHLDDGATGSDIVGIVSTRPSRGLTRLLQGTGGLADLTFIATQQADPAFEFTSIDLRTLVQQNSSKFLIKGLGLSSALIGNFYWQALADRSDRATGSSHQRFQFNQGLLIPTMLDASHGGGSATMTCAVAPTWDGTNAAMVVTKGVALPTFTATAYRYALGPVKLNSTTFNHYLDSMRLDTGLSLRKVGGGGNTSPVFVAILTRRPTLTLQLTDGDVLADYGVGGTALTSGTIYLRRYEQGQPAYADGESQHIKLTLYEGHISADEGSAAQDELGRTTVTVALNHDGSNDIITAAVDQAIT